MEKENFFKILCNSTPEDLNEMISKSGSQKMVNGICFIQKENKNDNNTSTTNEKIK